MSKDELLAIDDLYIKNIAQNEFLSRLIILLCKKKIITMDEVAEINNEIVNYIDQGSARKRFDIYNDTQYLIVKEIIEDTLVKITGQPET